MANDVSSTQVSVLADLPRSDITAAQALIEIVNSVLEYENTRFFFNEQRLGPVSLTATNTYAFSLWAPATTSVSQASAIIEVDSFRINLSSRSYTLDEVPYTFLDDIDEASTSTSGYPEMYAIYNQSFRIYPTPSSALTMTGTVSAHVKFPELASANDANVWTLEAKNLIRHAAVKRLWMNRLQDNPQMPQSANNAMQLEQQALAALLRRTTAVAGHRIRSFL